jgi:COP9 signalosome complex subunit 1
LDEIKKQNIPLPHDFDTTWYERTQRNYVHKLERLDTDLRNFRTNSIKDSIRRGHDDLGDHYLDAGDFFNAVRCYVRSRDYCVTPRHMITMCMNVIKASFYMQNWSNVLSYVSKAEQAIESLESTAKSTATPTSATVISIMNPMEVASASTTNATIASDAILASRLKVYAGIAELATKRYKLAARHFLGVSFDHCSNHFQVRFLHTIKDIPSSVSFI